MEIIAVLLVLAAWTGVGLVAALLFFRLGFGFQVRRREAGEDAPAVTQPGAPGRGTVRALHPLNPLDRPARRRSPVAADAMRGASPAPASEPDDRKKATAAG